MAVYTHVSEAELKRFLRSYEIGDLMSYEGIAAGVSNTNYHVFTDHDHFILTLFEPHRVHADDIPFFIDYTIHLEDHGVMSPKTMVLKDGQTVAQLNGRPAVMSSFLEGQSLGVADLTPALCEKAGRTLARMHVAAESFPQSQANRFGFDQWRVWLEKMGRRLNEIGAGLYLAAVAELSWIEDHWPKDLPYGAIDGDFFPDNVFFKDGQVSGVIDFHFVCSDFFAYDLAIAVTAWTFDADNQFVPERLDALLAGYQALRPLSAAEMLAFPVLLRGAALRFLLSRCEEKFAWQVGDFMTPHDPMVFAKRVQFFKGRDTHV